MNEKGLIQWSKLKSEIDQARGSLQDLSRERGKIDTLKTWAEEMNASQEIINDLTMYQVRIRGYIAEAYSVLPDNRGRRAEGGEEVETSKQEALEEIGVSRTSVSSWLQFIEVDDWEALSYEYEKQAEKASLKGFIKFASGKAEDGKLESVYRNIKVYIEGDEIVDVQGLPAHIRLLVHKEGQLCQTLTKQ